MSAAAAPARPTLRIGELARRVGTTPRTIRYYEELLVRRRQSELGVLEADLTSRRDRVLARLGGTPRAA